MRLFLSQADSFFHTNEQISFPYESLHNKCDQQLSSHILTVLIMVLRIKSFFFSFQTRSKRDISTINTLRIDFSHHTIEMISAQDKQVV
jgi:hypothetical protein